MASRAERRRMMRSMDANEKIKLFQESVNRAKMDIKKMEQFMEDARKAGNGFSAQKVEADERFHKRFQAREQVRKIIEHNGITLQDLEDAHERGRKEGFIQAAEPIIKCCYAGIIIALHDEFGFGGNRCARAVKAVDEKIIYALDHLELAEEVLEKTGIELQMDDPFERVTMKK